MYVSYFHLINPDRGAIIIPILLMRKWRLRGVSNLPNATQLGLQPRSRWTLKPTILISDLHCKLPEYICKLQIPRCFLQRAHQGQEPMLPSTAVRMGACVGGQGKEHVKRTTSIAFSLPDSGSEASQMELLSVLQMRKQRPRRERHPPQDQEVAEQGFTSSFLTTFQALSTVPPS